MNSTIEITFNSPLAENEYIQWDTLSQADPAFEQILIETWATVRNASKLIPVGWLGQSDAENFAYFFNIDYNSTNKVLITRNANVVTIQSNIDWYYFDNFVTNAPGKVSAVISGAPSFSDFEITSHLVSSPLSGVCDYFRINIQTNNNIKNYVLDNTQVDVGDTEITIDYPRGQDFSIILRDDDDYEIYFPTQTTVVLNPNNIVVQKWKYDKLLLSNLTVNVSIGLQGSTIQLNVLNVERLDLEYSLDDTNWQTENVFSGQPEGDYTVYIRDQFGCKIQKDFTVDGVGTRKPFFMISNASSIPFILIEDVDNCSVFPNERNSFSSKDLVKIAYCTNILYNQCDKTRIQFKSNYATNNVKRRDEFGNEESIDIEKMTNNLSRYEKLDCIYYRHESGKLGVYFTSGNVYDENGDIIRQHELEGYLPDFGVAGNYVQVGDLGTYQIQSIVLDESINKNVLLFDQVYSGATTVSTAESIYDLLSYEVYEFNVDFSVFSLGLNDIHIQALSSDGEQLDLLSSNIEVAVEHPDTIGIRYYNPTSVNRDVFYKFGIQHFIREKLEDYEGGFKDDSENNVTDEETSQIESFLNEKVKWIFQQLTLRRYRRLYIALSLDIVFINNEGYVKDGNFNTTREVNTNLYQLEADLIKSGLSYSDKESGYTGSDEISLPSYSGPLLTANTNFIKISK